MKHLILITLVLLSACGTKEERLRRAQENEARLNSPEQKAREAKEANCIALATLFGTDMDEGRQRCSSRYN